MQVSKARRADHEISHVEHALEPWRSAAMRVALLAGACVVVVAGPAAAETMSTALARAYVANPDLNQQRAAVRVTDENIPRAKAGWLPKVSATGIDRLAVHIPAAGPEPDHGNPPTRQRPGGVKYNDAFPQAYGVQATETLFDGFRTLNTVRQAESQTFGARETMRNTEAGRPAQRRHRLHERAARHRHPGSAQEQHQRSRGTIAPDPRPLPGRRGDAHRRRAGRSEPGAVAIRLFRRAVAVADFDRQLPPVDRRRAAQARAGPEHREHAAEAAQLGAFRSRRSSTRRSPARCTMSTPLAPP